MCNWTWSHFAWEYSDPTRLDFTWKSRQTSHTQFVKRLCFFEQGPKAGEHFSESLFPKWLHVHCSCTLLLCPQNHNQPPPSCPHTAFLQLTPPSLELICLLELSLYKEDKNTARCEFMSLSELPLKIWTFSDIHSETQVRKQSDHSVYTESPQHKGI